MWLFKSKPKPYKEVDAPIFDVCSEVREGKVRIYNNREILVPKIFGYFRGNQDGTIKDANS